MYKKKRQQTPCSNAKCIAKSAKNKQAKYFACLAHSLRFSSPNHPAATFSNKLAANNETRPHPAFQQGAAQNKQTKNRLVNNHAKMLISLK
jgi:hypothetical protein